jgi:hypothetical protein
MEEGEGREGMEETREGEEKAALVVVVATGIVVEQQQQVGTTIGVTRRVELTKHLR